MRLDAPDYVSVHMRRGLDRPLMGPLGRASADELSMDLPIEFLFAGACVLARRPMGCRWVYRWNLCAPARVYWRAGRWAVDGFTDGICVRRRVYTGAPADGLSMGFADEFFGFAGASRRRAGLYRRRVYRRRELDSINSFGASTPDTVFNSNLSLLHIAVAVSTHYQI